ncbi:MAG: hypothetical protein KGN36_04705 [Acidobacteriota bacterium]|nr:hypothetical protein [Acidobacteriota bacterium]
MNRNRVWIAGLGLLVALVPCVSAQDHRAEVFGGYSYAKINPEANNPKENANGWMGGAAGYANKWFGAGFEIAAQFGNMAGPGGTPPVSFKEYSYMVGPQVRFLRTKKVEAGAKILLGGVFGQARLDPNTSAAQIQALTAAGYSNFDSTKFAMMVGFPVDVTVTKLLGIRFEPGLYRTSFLNMHESNFRFSVGPVFRFGGR